MAARLLALLLVLVLVVLAFGVVVGLLAYGTVPARSGRVALPALRAEATVRWNDDLPTIEARSLVDTYAALGYVHALESAWTMALWRQAATGRLAVWFGATAQVYDRHAHALGLAAQAAAAFEALPADQQRLLEAYAGGVNRALQQPAIAQTDEFVLREVEPTPWAPWHALAVERLLAYLGTEPPALLTGDAPPADTTADAATQTLHRLAASDEAQAFAAHDRLFRAALFLGDFSASYAWTAPHATSEDGPVSRTWMVQQGYGASALPLVQEVAVEREGRRVVLATVPGTPLLPSALTSGPDGQGGWQVLLTGALDLTTTTAAPLTRYARLVDRAGQETLITARRSDALLALTTPDLPPAAERPAADTLNADSLGHADTLAVSTESTLPGTLARPALALRWRGFSTATDTPAWTTLLARALGYSAPDTPPPFALIEGDGLRLDGDAWTVLGTPAVERALPDGVFVGGEPAHAYAADRLADLLETAPVLTPATVATDRHSSWAARAVPAWLDALDTPFPARFEDAAAYLRGWSYHYDPRAIAPTIFDRWTVAFAATRPDSDGVPVRIDSTAGFAARASLARTLDTLRATFGSDPSAWRWENTQPQARYFPIWSSPTDTLVHGPAERRYAPARLGLGGHPTALRGGTSPAFPNQGSAASWTAWSRADIPARTTTLHATVTTRGPLARALDTVNLDQPRSYAPPASGAPALRLSPSR